MKIAQSFFRCLDLVPEGNTASSKGLPAPGQEVARAIIETGHNEKFAEYKADARCCPALRSLFKSPSPAVLPDTRTLSFAKDRNLMTGDFIYLGRLPKKLDHYLKVKPCPMPLKKFEVLARYTQHRAKYMQWQAYETYGCSWGARQVNDALRAGSSPTTQIQLRDGSHTNLQLFCFHVEHLVTDIPKGTQFVRYIGNRSIGGTQNIQKLKEVKRFLSDAKKGDILQEPGFLSTSVPSAVIDNVGLDKNRIRFDFTAGPDVKAALFDNMLGEALFMPNQRFAISKVVVTDERITVKATLLPYAGLGSSGN